MSLYLPNAQARFFPLSFSSSQFSSSPKIRRFFSPVSWSNSLHSCPCKLNSFSEAFLPHSAADEENVIGDCLVFEDGAFEDPFPPDESHQNSKKPRRPKKPPAVKEVDLIPEEWKEVQAEINLSKKDRRKIAQKLEYGSRIERTKTVRLSDLEEYKSERATKLSQLKPVVLEKPREPQKETIDDSDEDDEVEPASSSSGRVVPKNPRALETIAKGSMEDISKLFTSGDYEPPEDDGRKTSEGRRKLFTKEEKVLLNRRIPNLFVANSSKWFPLHTLAASGEFYLMDKLLKHSVDINAVDKNGLTALHRAILCKKQAIANYLLRESANPFVRDEEGATLMHYAVRAANIQMIKILILYNVDVNLPDEEGWTPLHLGVQTRRTDVLRLLLIKGADKTVKNRDGLTPLDLCLYSGRDKRTYELIKILKELPKSK